MVPYRFDFELIYQGCLTLMQPAEFIDLVLVFASNLQLILPYSRLIVFGKLVSGQRWVVTSTNYDRPFDVA